MVAVVAVTVAFMDETIARGSLYVFRPERGSATLAKARCVREGWRVLVEKGEAEEQQEVVASAALIEGSFVVASFFCGVGDEVEGRIIG